MMASFEEQFQQLFSGLVASDLEEVAVMKLEGFTNAEIAAHLGRHERSIERKLALIRKHWQKIADLESR